MEAVLKKYVHGIPELACLIMGFLWVSPPLQCANCRRFYGYNSIRRHERTCATRPGGFRRFCLRCMRTYSRVYYRRHRCIPTHANQTVTLQIAH